jgi:hypothetical protein
MPSSEHERFDRYMHAVYVIIRLAYDLQLHTWTMKLALVKGKYNLEMDGLT